MRKLSTTSVQNLFDTPVLFVQASRQVTGEDVAATPVDGIGVPRPAGQQLKIIL
jgi:hypothetical protein